MRIKTFITIALIVAGSAFCSKEKYMSLGVILGPDLRMCACCGGWFINIDTTIYEFTSLPGNSDIDLQSATFPLNAKLNWQFSQRGACPDKFITILAIMKE